jgi:hypothetical protein
MEVNNLISFDEIYVEQPLNNNFNIENQLIEKNIKIKILEDKIKLLEKNNNSTFSVIPIINNNNLQFLNINSKLISIKLDYIYFDNCKFEMVMNFDFNFFTQFKNIKILEFDFEYKNKYSEVYQMYNTDTLDWNCRSFANLNNIDNLINIVKTIISSNKDLKIIYKCNNLDGDFPHKKLFDELIKFQYYTEIIIKIKNNLTYKYEQSYINQLNEHYMKNNIIFTSSIGSKNIIT